MVRSLERHPVSGEPDTTPTKCWSRRALATKLERNALTAYHRAACRRRSGLLNVGAGNPRDTRASAGASGKPAPPVVLPPQASRISGKWAVPVQSHMRPALGWIDCLREKGICRLCQLSHTGSASAAVLTARAWPPPAGLLPIAVSAEAFGRSYGSFGMPGGQHRLLRTSSSGASEPLERRDVDPHPAVDAPFPRRLRG